MAWEETERREDREEPRPSDSASSGRVAEARESSVAVISGIWEVPTELQRSQSFRFFFLFYFIIGPELNYFNF